MKRKILVQRLRRAEKHNGVVTFKYFAPSSKQKQFVQSPVVLVRTVEKVKGRITSFTGIALNRLTDDQLTKQATRKYLLERVCGSLQRLR